MALRRRVSPAVPLSGLLQGSYTRGCGWQVTLSSQRTQDQVTGVSNRGRRAPAVELPEHDNAFFVQRILEVSQKVVVSGSNLFRWLEACPVGLKEIVERE